MKKVCIVITFFKGGRIQRFKPKKFPRWMNLFVESCKHNPTVDWLIFTDFRLPKNRADNVKFIKMSLNKFCSLASKKIGFKIRTRCHYKVCDFKPAYGLIFEDYIKNYDFWGHDDIDKIFGNFRKIITDKLLEKYDVISTEESKVVGYLTLFKNNKKVNNTFRQSKDYKRVFQDGKKHYTFDEDGKDIENMTKVVEKMKSKKKIKYYSKDLTENDVCFWKFRFYWNKGKLIKQSGEYKKGLKKAYKTGEVLCFHFMFFKNKKGFLNYNFEYDQIPNGFFITNDGFVKA